MQDSKDFISKGIKASKIHFNYEEQLLELEDDGEEKQEKLDMLNKVRKLVIGTAEKKLTLITGLANKFAETAGLISETNPDLAEEIQSILYNKEMDEEIKSLLKS